MGVMIQNRQRVDQGRGDEGGPALSDLRFWGRRWCFEPGPGRPGETTNRPW
jgi:hypothetical protein